MFPPMKNYPTKFMPPALAAPPVSYMLAPPPVKNSPRTKFAVVIVCALLMGDLFVIAKFLV